MSQSISPPAPVTSQSEPAPPTKPASGSTMSKYGWVDALRGIAILMVMVYHSGIPGGPGPLRALVSQGSRGVQLFFLMSGFTLLLSHQKRKAEEASPLRNYYLRRFFRIAPAFYFGLVIYLIYSAIPGAHEYASPPRDASGILATLFPFIGHWHWPSIQTLVPGGWSISVETMFYVILPGLFFVLKNYRQALYFTIASIVLAVVSEAALQPVLANSLGDKTALEYLQLWLPSQLAYFGFGFMLYYWFVDRERDKLTKQTLIGVGVVAAVMALAVAGLVVVYRGGFFSHAVALFKTPFKLAFGPLFLGLSMYVALKQPKWLVNNFTRQVGIVSFSSYILHFLVIFTLERFLPKPHMLVSVFVVIPVVVAVTFGLASLVYRFIETPGTAFGKRLIDRLERREQPGSVTA